MKEDRQELENRSNKWQLNDSHEEQYELAHSPLKDDVEEALEEDLDDSNYEDGYSEFLTH